MLRAEFDFIRAQSQTSQQQALRDLDRAFDRFFAGIADFPKPRQKGFDDTARIQGRECCIRSLNTKWSEVKVPKIGWVRFRSTRNVPSKLLSATFSHRAVEGWTVSFACEQPAPVELSVDRPVVGIDRGIVHTLALSDGGFIDMPTERLRLLDRRRRRAQKLAARGKRGSNRNRKAKLWIAALSAKAGRIRKHWIHVTTKRLAETYSVVVVEALRIKNMSASASGCVEKPGRNVRQKAGLNRSILEQAWGMFDTILSYKMDAVGGVVGKVSAMNTSRECPRCGHYVAENRESQAAFRCVSCGFIGNADTVAAVNVRRRWITPLMDVEAARYGPCEALPEPEFAKAA